MIINEEDIEAEATEPSSKEYEILKKMSHRSKDLYNKTLYIVRQCFFGNGEYLNYYNAYKLLKDKSENYRVLPSQVAQQTMKHVDTPRRIRKPFGLRCGSKINKSLIQTSPKAPS